MITDCQVADILYFEKYFFTDNNKSAPHFGLVILPPYLTRIPFSSVKLANNIWCCVITSKKSRRFFLLLLSSKYSCLKVDSYACFDRMDINSLTDLDDKYSQPVASLDKKDIKESLKTLRTLLFTDPKFIEDKFLRATIIREWKNKRDSL